MPVYRMKIHIICSVSDIYCHFLFVMQGSGVTTRPIDQPDVTMYAIFAMYVMFYHSFLNQAVFCLSGV